MAQKPGGLGKGLSSLIPSKKYADYQQHGGLPRFNSDDDYPTNKKEETKSGQFGGSSQASQASQPINQSTSKKQFDDTEGIARQELSSGDVSEDQKRDERQKEDYPSQERADFKPIAGVHQTELDKEAHQHQQHDEEILEKLVVVEVPVDSIVPNPHQPRREFNHEKLQELAQSIKEHGIIQPLVVSFSEEGQHELIAGERRLRAAREAGLRQVPVVLKDVDEQKKVEWALIENVQREDLNPMEEAWAYHKMQDIFSFSQAEVASRVGKSRSAVANTMRLLDLPKKVQRILSEGDITEGHARAILSLEGEEKRLSLLDLIVREGLTVREAEKRAESLKRPSQLRKKPEVNLETQEKEEELSSILGSRVRIKKKSRGGGQVVIECYSKNSLEEILDKLERINA